MHRNGYSVMCGVLGIIALFLGAVFFGVMGILFWAGFGLLALGSLLVE